MKKLLILLILLALFVFFAFFYYYNSAVNYGSKIQAGDLMFSVAAGDSVETIAKNLKSQGLIKSSFFFKFYVWQSDKEAELKAGEYILNQALSIMEIVNVITNGQSISRELEIKIIEGWKITEIDKYLSEQRDVDISNFAALTKKTISNWPFEFTKPAFFDEVPSDIDLEGYLFPDTYRIFKDATAGDIVKKMLDNFDNKFNQELRDEIKLKGKSINEIVTMASIIEKEVNNEKDRPKVAGIFYKRLAIGMRLEVDSTVNYITGKNDPSAEYKDLEIDSPYNTYKYYGLPPGPISSPGLSAIKAAIYPEESEYLFYLNRQDTGETIFSKNFDEHIRNKNKYLK